VLPCDIDLPEALDFARALAMAGGDLSLRHFQTPLDVERKGDGSPVTAADREVEAHIRDAIQSAWPGHGIIGEESGSRRPDAPFTWVVDPIDGTSAFLHGVPLYGVLIALEYQKTPILGVVNCPAAREIVSAAVGLGCWWNGRRCAVSRTAALKDGLVVASAWHGATVRPGAPSCARLMQAGGAFRTWGHCYGFLLVATGRADVMIDAGLKHWDTAALIPILCEAGGTMTDWRGGPVAREGNALATNGLVLAETLDCLAE